MVGIKDMEMPSGCQRCKFFRKRMFGNGLDYSYSCMFGATEFPCPWIRQMEERASDCPLVDIKEPKTDKALNLLAEWAIECGFGYDNIPEEYEKYKDDIAEMGYSEGLVYIVKMESEGKE